MHYHGTPISPRAKMLEELQGRCFCVSFEEPRDIEVCHEIGQSVLLDNGAYSAWTKGRRPDWDGYYAWCEKWLQFPTTWAVIPDVIEATEAENDLLIADWPHGTRGAPVWHMGEPLERLVRLAKGWPRVCVGSSAAYADPTSRRWRHRMEDAMNALCGTGPVPVWLHMLRAMDQVAGGPYPFASADSTNLARNHGGASGHHPRCLRLMADAIDARQAPARWTYVERTIEMAV